MSDPTRVHERTRTDRPAGVPAGAPGASPDPFVNWVRQATPYIHAHRGCTFVVCFGGEAVADPGFAHLIHDLALLHGLGVRLVLVHGARPQIEARLTERHCELRYVNGLRVTDDTALGCVKEAAGVVRVEIEALLSMGLADSPMAGVRIPVASGNFVTARPLGVLDGVDYRQTGVVRRVDRQSLLQRLDAGAVALMPPLGYSPTGEVFNLSAADVARSAAIALQADKLIFLTEEPGIYDDSGALISNILSSEVEALLAPAPDPAPGAGRALSLAGGGPGRLPEDLAQALRAGADACIHGVRRVHLIDRHRDGALLRELYTRDGSGTLITGQPYEDLRAARTEDVTGVLELLRPLEERGVLVRRSRERLETEIDRYFLMERDGLVIACAALYPYPAQRMGELAGVVVHEGYRGGRRGDKLVAHIEAVARRRGLTRLFVLTTQTAHWFQERGFLPARREELPDEKQALYDRQRNSLVFIKDLST